MIIFDRNDSDCRKLTQPYGYQILVLFIFFEFLLHPCKMYWILNSSFLKYLATALQTNVSNFLAPFWFGITKRKGGHFQRGLRMISGLLHYPNRSQTSGNGISVPHLPTEEGSSRLFVLHIRWRSKIKID